MQGTVGNLAAVFHQSLSAVTVVYVPVEDGDAVDSGFRECIASGDRSVGKQAKTHRPIALSMVSRRPGEYKSRFVSCQHSIDSIEPSTRRQQRYIVTFRRNRRIAVEVAASPMSQMFDFFDVSWRVNLSHRREQFWFALRYWRWQLPLDAIGPRSCFQSIGDRR